MIPDLDVYDQSEPFGANGVLVGKARFHLRHGSISTTFSYDETYVANTLSYPIDPRLPLQPGSHHVPGLPGMMRDSAPDRWGRNLVRKGAPYRFPPRSACETFDEVDYLVQTFDLTREGSLRYRTSETGFLSPHENVPPQIQLPRLLEASRHLAKNESGMAEIKELLDAGSGSLGGARPKASARDGETLLLAKFPHPQDEWNVMAWEQTAIGLAAASGINVPTSRLVRLGGDSILLQNRFDRTGSLLTANRIPYMSAMTALCSDDGDACDYGELCETIIDMTKIPEYELAELFARLCLFVAINNTDDHLRNWAFLRTGVSWRLSPAFDINPNPDPQAMNATSFAGFSGADRAKGLQDLGLYAGLSGTAMSAIAGRILRATSRWKTIAKRNGCTESEINRFTPAIESGRMRLEEASRSFLI